MRRPWREDEVSLLVACGVQGLCRDLAVLVDEPTEHIVAADLWAGLSCGRTAGGRAEVEAAMRALVVVVAGVLPPAPLRGGAARAPRPSRATRCGRPARTFLL